MFHKKEKMYMIQRQHDGQFSQQGWRWGKLGKCWNKRSFKLHLNQNPTKYDDDTCFIITMQEVDRKPFDPENFDG